MQNFSQDLLASHARLCSLENELSKERDGLITNYNRGGPNSNRTLYGSYYPMLAKYTDFADKYVMELAKFKKLLEKSVQQKPSINNNNTSNNTTNNQTDIINTNDNINNNNNTNNNLNNNTSRKFATMNNGNYNNNDNDDGKQPDIDQQQQHHHQQQSQDETKLSSLYDEPQQQPPPPPPPPPQQQQQQRVPTKPPVKSSNGVSILPPQQRIIEPQQQNQRERMITTTSHKPRNRTIKVSRHKYKYEGRGFDIWKQNLRRPIYTSTTLKIFRKFGTDKLAQHAREKLVKKWLYEKGGFKQELIEQITFIGGKGRENNDNNQRVSDFTLVRVRASLKYIYKCIDKIDIEVGRGVVIKQNNRPKASNNAANSKLYVTNFDILDPNTHRKLNDIFLEFGELEQDIFIGKDWKNNPYALVHFRNIKDAVRCVQSQNTKYNHKDIIFFPQITETTDNNYNDDNSSPNRKYLNRKLHIEYNRSDNQQSNGNRGRRGRGRGGRNYQSRR